MYRELIGAGGALQLIEPADRVLATGATHFFGRLQAAAKRRAFGFAEDAAALVFAKLDAPDTSWLPVRNLMGYQPNLMLLNESTSCHFVYSFLNRPSGSR